MDKGGDSARDCKMKAAKTQLQPTSNRDRSSCDEASERRKPQNGKRDCSLEGSEDRQWRSRVTRSLSSDRKEMELAASTKDSKQREDSWPVVIVTLAFFASVTWFTMPEK
jgi:hypothetical protein